MSRWRMPAETAAQERVWMAFPVEGYSLGDTAEARDQARTTWAAAAHAIAEFEPVTMIVDPGEIGPARDHLSSAIEIVEAPLNDAWARDIGPTFVLDDNGALGAVDWIFNGWGAASWAQWDKDQHIGKLIAEHSGAEVIDSPMINEGGGIQVDGAGSVLLTESVQLGDGRNSTWTKAEVEAELARTIGAVRPVWLPYGLTRDNKKFGTRGHVDIVAALPSPGVVLVHDQQNPDHPDFEVSKQIKATIAAAEPNWEIIGVPAPTVLTDDEGPVDYSYINHLVVNGGVIACSFGDRHDQRAADILAEVYPGRTVRSVDARPLFERGGGIHCITQNQPVSR
ncbi:agmatine deiminase family protein [Williamsia sp.]|uniref:agmatine deiminase family protein n=1 Tax=Williamsia sp. TaxID=1872085 RepID=UPI002F9598F5